MLLCRHLVLIVVVSLGLSAGLLTPTAVAEEAPRPDALELYTEFMRQYEAGQFERAREIFRQIDPTELPDEQRTTLNKTMLEIGQRTGAANNGNGNGGSQNDPKALLSAADAAKEGGRYDLAISLYMSVKDSPAATDQQKAAAQAGLAEATRRKNSDLASAQLLIAEARADLAAGRINAAQRKINQVRQGGVQLGWNDQERLERLERAIAEQLRVTDAVENGGTMAAADGNGGGNGNGGDATPPTMPENGTAQPDPTPTPSPTPQPTYTDPIDINRTLRAQELVAKGQESLNRSAFDTAAEYFDEALQLDPGNVEALEGKKMAQRQMPGRLGPTEVGSAVIQQQMIRNQQTIARFEELMNTAEDLLNNNQFVQAENTVDQAKIVLDRNPGFPRDKYNELKERAVQMSVAIARKEEQVRLEQIRTTIRETEETARDQRIAAQKALRDRVNRLLSRANELRKERKYDAALELLNQAIFLEPTNVAAAAMRDVIEENRLYREYQATIEERKTKILEHSLENADATIPWTELMTYPSDWPQLTQRRLASIRSTQEESKENRLAAQKLQDPVPFTFQGNKLEDVIAFLRRTIGINIYVNWPALENNGVTRDTPIDMELQNVPADKGLDLILEQASAGAVQPLAWAILDGIVRISTQEDLRANVETKVYDIRDLLIQIPNFDNAPEFDLNEALQNSGERDGGGGGGGGIFGTQQDGGLGEEQKTRTQLIEEIITIIQDTVGRPEDWKALGGRSDARELNGNLIVRTTTQNHREVVDLLNKLREARTMQIHVEARFLIVSQNFLEEIGLDVDVNIANTAPWGDVKIGQDSFNLTGRPAGALPGSFGDLAPASVGALVFTEGIGFGPTNTALDISAAYLDDVEVNVLLQATKAHRQATSLSAPRVTFFNGQTAYVTIATQTAFVSDLEPVPDSLGFDPTISVASSGVVLQVTGTISADRRYVTLTLTPRLATLESIEEFEITAVFDPDDIGGGGDDDDDDDTDADLLFASGRIQVPTLSLTEVRTTVSVPDKGTLLLGGQRLVSEVEVEAGVPILSTIPILNRLFANETKLKDERTILILVKPTIIIQSEEEELNFPGLLQDPENYGIGTMVPSQR